MTLVSRPEETPAPREIFRAANDWNCGPAGEITDGPFCASYAAGAEDPLPKPRDWWREPEARVTSGCA
jgi:hypothetical protein